MLIQTRKIRTGALRTLCAAVVAANSSSVVMAQVGFVDFDGTTTGLTGYNNDALVGGGISTNGNLSNNETYLLFASSGDAFNPMSRAALSPVESDGQQVGMPFNISDDSVAAATGNSVFPADVLGFAGVTKPDGFFGITDNVNASNPTGTNTAIFSFNITGVPGPLMLQMDFAAMGSFASADSFVVDYSIDGGAFVTAFSGAPVVGVMQSYFMDSGTQVDLTDPYSINGTTLTDNFQTLAANIVGVGNTLDIRVTASFDGNKGIGFDNLTVVPEPASLSLLGVAGVGLLGRRRRS